MQSKISYGILLCTMFLLSGCVKTPSYNPRPLKSISIESNYTAVAKNVILRVKKLTKAEIFHLFGKRGERFKNHHLSLVPLHISIHNLSNTSLILDPKNIDLESLSYRSVSKQLQTSSIGKTIRTIGCGALMAVLTMGAGFFGIMHDYSDRNNSWIDNSKLLVNIAVPLIIISTPFIAFIKTIRSARTNGKIKRDIREKILRKKVTIYSGQQYDTLLFVQSVDYRSNFTLTLVEEDKPGKITTFNIGMKKNNFVQLTKDKKLYHC